MAKRQSAWKQMINYYRDEYREQHAPTIYGDVWLQTKSHQRLILGLTAAATPATPVTALALPTKGQHLASGATLVTLTSGETTQTISTPFGGTVQKVNTALLADAAQLSTNAEKDNWLVQLKAD